MHRSLKILKRRSLRFRAASPSPCLIPQWFAAAASALQLGAGGAFVAEPRGLVAAQAIIKGTIERYASFDYNFTIPSETTLLRIAIFEEDTGKQALAGGGGGNNLWRPNVQ